MMERRAYELYLDRGRADGQDLAHWFAAERELMGFRKRLVSGAPRVGADRSATATAGRVGRGKALVQ